MSRDLDNGIPVGVFARLGGRALYRRRGGTWMAAIGAHGGDEVFRRRGSEYMREIGRRGGESNARRAKGGR